MAEKIKDKKWCHHCLAKRHYSPVKPGGKCKSCGIKAPERIHDGKAHKS